MSKKLEHEFGEVLKITEELDADSKQPITQHHRRCKNCGRLNTSLNIGAFWCDPDDVKGFGWRKSGLCTHCGKGSFGKYPPYCNGCRNDDHLLLASQNTAS